MTAVVKKVKIISKKLSKNKDLGLQAVIRVTAAVKKVKIVSKKLSKDKYLGL